MKRAALAAFACALSMSAAAMAADRPFLMLSSAVQEDDDERVWEVSSWLEAGKRLRSFNIEAEYSFAPDTAVQIGWGRGGTKSEGEDGVEVEHETEVELELRRGLLDPARHGLGVALVLEVRAGSEHSGGERTGWRHASSSLSLPMSWPWQHGSWLHATFGVEQLRDNGIRPWAAVGMQHKLSRAADLFAEWGATRSRDGVAQLGVRWWAKREKLAIDLGLARHRGGDERVNTVVIGVSAMDLSF